MDAMHMDGVHMDAMCMDAIHMDASGYMMCTVPPSMPMGMLVPAASQPDSNMLVGMQASEQPVEQATANKAGVNPKDLLLPLASKQGKLAARALAKRVLEARRWKANHSTFSALNVDIIRRAPGLGAGPAAEQRPISSLAQVPRKEKQLVKRAVRQYSVTSQETMLPDSDGKESDSCSRITSMDEWDEISQEAQQHSSSTRKPSFEETRNSLLGFRSLAVGPVPQELRNLRVDGAEQRAPVSVVPFSPVHRACSTTKPLAKVGGDAPHGGQALTAHRSPVHSRSRREELRRNVQSHLNKICPENVCAIVDKIAAIEVTDLDQLETIIELIFKKALAEPHYCETYADLVFSLKSVFPEFLSPDSGKPITFKSSVLNICQNEFEELLAVIKPANEEEAQYESEELELRRTMMAGRMRANMKFIGHLFLRRLLSAKVIGSVLCELVLCEFLDYVPEEHAIECACELLVAVGYTLEAMPAGAHHVQQVCARLLDLKSRKTPEGKAAYCKRIQFMIQDVLDARAAGWAMKLFKSSAKTKEEIRLEQQRDMGARSRGNTSAGVEEVVVAGQRPQYLAPTAISA